MHVVLYRRPRREGHDCEGEAIVIRLVSPSLGWVVHAGRCAQDPALGCDGVPAFPVGSVVRTGEGSLLRGQGWIDMLRLRAVAGAKP